MAKKKLADDGRKSKIRNKTNTILPSNYPNVPALMVAERMLALPPGVIWRRHHLGIKIQQLQSTFYNAVIDLLQNNTLLVEPSCRTFEIHRHWEPMEEMLNEAMDWLAKCTSLVAMDEVSGQVYGVLIGRIVNNEELLNEVEELKRIEIEEQLQKEKERLEGEALKVKLENETKHKKVAKSGDKGKVKTIGGRTSTENDSIKSPRTSLATKFNKSVASLSMAFTRSSARLVNHSNKATSRHKMSFKRQGSRMKDVSTDLSVKATQSNVSNRLQKNLRKTKIVPRVSPPVDIIPAEEIVVKESDYHAFDDSYEGFKNDILTEFLKFRYSLFNSLDIFNNYNVRCYYKMYVWAVDSEFQNKGIGSTLLTAAIDMCQQLQIPVIASICTSHISQVVAQKYDFFKIESRDYKDLERIEVENEEEAWLMLKLLEVPVIDTYITKVVEGQRSKKQITKDEDKTKKKREKKKVADGEQSK